MPDFKLDIFQTLSALDQHKQKWLSEQPEDARKAFAGIVVMRWLSSVNTNAQIAEYYIQAVNEYANKHFWDLANHPDLQFKTCALVGTGKKYKHDWIPMAGAIRNKNKAYDFLGQQNPHLPDKDLEMLFDLHTVETFKEMLIDAGVQKDDEKELMAAFKKKAKK